MPTKTEEMTDAEKTVAFNKWLSSRSARKATNTAKRAAQKAFKATYQAEYEKLTKTVTVNLKAKPAEDLTQAEKAAKYDAIISKKSGRQSKTATNRAALAALQKAHAKEWAAALAAVSKKK